MGDVRLWLEALATALLFAAVWWLLTLIGGD